MVSRLRRAMRRSARAAYPASRLSVAQLELLSCLAENPGARPGQLAQLLRLAPSSVTTLVNSLRTLGLVTRVSSAGDRRMAQLDVTAAGADAVAAWQSVNKAIMSRALGRLSAGSRAALRAALPALLELTAAIDMVGDEPQPGLLGPEAPAGQA